ncbi:MAG TPA: hypothetical protein VLM42_04140, partial [Bryobacteraceae bacterium]|nr:hypothetical protein [Bryobacteraceae bacterium]
YCDGRIDVNGPSFRKILTLLNKPLPPGAPAAPPNSGPSQPAPAGQPPSGVNMDKAFHGFRFSPWKLSGSAGFSAGASVIGISGGYLDLQYRDPADPDEDYDGRLYFGAAGGGVSVAPVSMQYSTGDMYSRSPWNILISPRQQGDMDFEDFQGLGAIISGGALSSVVPMGGSMSIYLFGINNLALPSYLIGAMFGGGLQMISLATIADAAVLSYGTTKGSPDMGISCQCGFFH